jgi:hypothetical protein
MEYPQYIPIMGPMTSQNNGSFYTPIFGQSSDSEMFPVCGWFMLVYTLVFVDAAAIPIMFYI